MDYKFTIDKFQGPLDLLLHLIKEADIDIFDINISEITEQYLKYIESMENLNLNIDSEYLVMAAELIEMKSRELLPHEENDVDDEYEEDPKEALINIITKPKNALAKQYKKLLALDNVELEFSQEALEAIVDKAIERKTGARGLRAIIEEIMKDIMFELPSNPKIEKCIITKETVLHKEAPKVIINNNRQVAKRPTKKRVEATQKTTTETA